MAVGRAASQPPLPTKRRKRARHLRVPVHPEEAEVIEAQAKAAGLSIAAYLRNVGMGYQPRATVDHEQIHEMLRINGDLGRLGGLLKLWLTDDRKLAQYPRGQAARAVQAALAKIESSQAELKAVVGRALRQGQR